MSNDDTDGWAFSEARDWLETRHRRDSHLPIHPGEIADKEARRTLTAMRQAFERKARAKELPEHAPPRVEETDTYRDLRAALGAETFAEAVSEGDSHRLRHFVGSQDDEPDISGLATLQTIQEIVCDTPLLLYIYGQQGNGKTFSAALLGQLWKHWVGGDVASNLRTIDAADEWIQRWSNLNDWMYVSEEDRLEGRYSRKLYIMDEANAVLGGQGSDGWNAKTKLAHLGYKIRHYGGSLIVVGHDGKDIAPSIRELCTIAHKTGTKTVRFYDSIKERTPRDPLTPELSGVPMPDKPWQPNTRDDADFFWGEEETAEDEPGPWETAVYTVIKSKQDGLTNRETAEYVPFSRTWVGERWNEYDEDGMHRDVVANVEELTA